MFNARDSKNDDEFQISGAHSEEDEHLHKILFCCMRNSPLEVCVYQAPQDKIVGVMVPKDLHQDCRVSWALKDQWGISRQKAEGQFELKEKLQITGKSLRLGVESCEQVGNMMFKVEPGPGSGQRI